MAESRILNSILALLRRVLVSLQSRIDGLSPPPALDAASRPEAFDPRCLHYPSRFPRLVEVPLERGIGLDLFPLAGQLHPFVRALEQATHSRAGATQLRQSLEEYYSRVQGLSAHQWLGLRTEESIFREHPAWARSLPWSQSTPQSEHDAIVKNALFDTTSAGKRLDISHGWKTMGPLSDELLDLEVKRLERLMAQIERHNYRLERPGKAVNATLLYAHDRQQWKWMVSSSGQHRVAVARVLGLDRIPVYVHGVVRRDEVHAWPQVVRGHIHTDDALAFFDRLMNGQLPPALQQWTDFVECGATKHHPRS